MAEAAAERRGRCPNQHPVEGPTCWDSRAPHRGPALARGTLLDPPPPTAGPGAHHHVVDGHPAVVGEVLQHGHQELQTAVPVAEQEHHANEVDDTHHGTRQVVGHVKDLRAEGDSGPVGGGGGLACSWTQQIPQLLAAPRCSARMGWCAQLGACPGRGEERRQASGQVLGEAACRQWGPRGMPSGIRVDAEHLPWGVQLPRPDT